MSFAGELWLPEGQPRRKQLDVVPLCRKVLLSWMRHTQTTLNPEDFEDALHFVVTAAWQVSLRYDPQVGTPFDVYLYGRLYHRPTDWLRVDEGRSRWTWSSHEYVRERPLAPLSLDAPAGSADGDSRVLGDVVAVRESSATADSHEALRQLELQRGRFRARDLRALREGLCEEVQEAAA